jgi:hypothetical protein
MTARKRRQVDWATVEREYRAGQLSIRGIARLHHVSDTAIRLKAEAGQWERTLAERVRQKVRETLVREDADLLSTSQSTLQSTSQGLARARDDEQIVESAAARGVEVVREHRGDLRQLRTVKNMLHDRLHRSVEEHAELMAAIDEETMDDKSAARKRKLMEAVSLGAQTRIAVDLTSMVAKIQPLERKAFNLDDERAANPDDPIERLWKELTGGAIRPDESEQPEALLPSAMRPTE